MTHKLPYRQTKTISSHLRSSSRYLRLQSRIWSKKAGLAPIGSISFLLVSITVLIRIRLTSTISNVTFYLPIIAKHLPSWFPGAGFKRLATKLRLEVEQMGQAPFTRVKQDIVSAPSVCSLVMIIRSTVICAQAAGTAIASITSAHLEETGGDEEKEELLKWAAASMYIGTRPFSLIRIPNEPSPIRI